MTVIAKLWVSYPNNVTAIADTEDIRYTEDTDTYEIGVRSKVLEQEGWHNAILSVPASGDGDITLIAETDDTYLYIECVLDEYNSKRIFKMIKSRIT